MNSSVFFFLNTFSVYICAQCDDYSLSLQHPNFEGFVNIDMPCWCSKNSLRCLFCSVTFSIVVALLFVEKNWWFFIQTFALFLRSVFNDYYWCWLWVLKDCVFCHKGAIQLCRDQIIAIGNRYSHFKVLRKYMESTLRDKSL